MCHASWPATVDISCCRFQASKSSGPYWVRCQSCVAAFMLSSVFRNNRRLSLVRQSLRVYSPGSLLSRPTRSMVGFALRRHGASVSHEKRNVWTRRTRILRNIMLFNARTFLTIETIWSICAIRVATKLSFESMARVKRTTIALHNCKINKLVVLLHNRTCNLKHRINI